MSIENFLLECISIGDDYYLKLCETAGFTKSLIDPRKMAREKAKQLLVSSLLGIKERFNNKVDILIKEVLNDYIE